VLTKPPPFSTGSILFLLFSLTFLASVLYLPQHIGYALRRLVYYVRGETVDDVVGFAKEAVAGLAHTATQTVAAVTVGKTVEAVAVAREL
jgi:hypothetical protein